MNKNNNPKRNDETYLGIENFQDYELTNCIAYEMAIRHSEVIRLKEEIDSLLKIAEKEFIDVGDHPEREFNNEFNALYKSYEESLENGQDEEDAEVPDYHRYFMEHNTNALEIKKKLHILINDYWIRYFFEKDIVNELLFDMEQKHFEKIARLKEHGLIGSHTFIGYSQDDRVVATDEIVFFSTKGTHKQIDINKVLINQRLNSLVIPKDYDKRIDVKINLALPKSELISFIEKLKDQYDEDVGIVRTPLELLGEALEQADNLICDKEGKCFDSRETLSKQEKLADMFYIYDCLKLGLTQRKIQNEVYNYYADIGKENKTLDAKTLKKYKEIVMDYIDNLRYKELVTGLKVR